jgi:hypothetical protein
MYETLRYIPEDSSRLYRYVYKVRLKLEYLFFIIRVCKVCNSFFPPVRCHWPCPFDLYKPAVAFPFYLPHESSRKSERCMLMNQELVAAVLGGEFLNALECLHTYYNWYQYLNYYNAT